MWETLPSLGFKLVRENKCFALDVVGKRSKDGFDVFESEVIEIYFLFKPVNFVLNVNLLGLVNGRSAIHWGFNFDLFILLIFLVGTK